MATAVDSDAIMKLLDEEWTYSNVLTGTSVICCATLDHVRENIIPHKQQLS